jgi:hypothetical protein
MIVPPELRRPASFKLNEIKDPLLRIVELFKNPQKMIKWHPFYAGLARFTAALQDYFWTTKRLDEALIHAADAKS